jgi:hypothetical protein
LLAQEAASCDPFEAAYFTLVILSVSSIQARTPFGTILGTVSDSTHSVVPEASVRIRGLAGNAQRVIRTDKNEIAHTTRGFSQPGSRLWRQSRGGSERPGG